MAGMIDGVKQFFGVESGAKSQNFPTGPVATTTPASNQRVASNRVVPMRSRRPSSDVTEIFTIMPRSYGDSLTIAENFRDGVTVIVNVSELPDAEKRSLFHFMLGLKEGLQGSIQRVTENVFLLTPYSVEVRVSEGEQTEQRQPDDLLASPYA